MFGVLLPLLCLCHLAHPAFIDIIALWKRTVDPSQATASLLQVLPSSIIEVAITNPAAASTLIEQAFSTETPAWFTSLPGEVQTYFIQQVGQSAPVTAAPTEGPSPVTTGRYSNSTTRTSFTSQATITDFISSSRYGTYDVTFISGDSSTSISESAATGASSGSDRNGLSTGAKAAVGVGVSVGVLGVLGLAGACLYARRRNRPILPAADPQQPNYPQPGVPLQLGFSDLPEPAPQKYPATFSAAPRDQFSNDPEVKAPAVVATPVEPDEKWVLSPTITITSEPLNVPVPDLQSNALVLELQSNPPRPSGKVSELPAAEQNATPAPYLSPEQPPATAPDASDAPITLPATVIPIAAYLPNTHPTYATETTTTVSPTSPQLPASVHGSDFPEVVPADDPEVARLRAERAKLQERRKRLLQLQQLDEEEERLREQLKSRLSQVGGSN